ncbi:hypothetical protein SAMD00023353_0102480 [Rosellinia necatrix]|uniref:Uncharacterized protein n=1 Tax=Rosellinia necatrix TaxID=77044 RepID=A0A1S8A4M9_ROSNE|nr:hypothetical protein SAMD00023353_0102480 [Rosellinia necatrix]
MGSLFILTEFLDIHNEILVVVKRGKGVDYQQKKVKVQHSDPPLLGTLGFSLMTVRMEDDEFVVYNEDTPSEEEDGPGGVLVETDVYTQPYEYNWNHLDRRVYTNMF